MAIVITPNGQYVDDQTGMPIDPRSLNELLPKGGAISDREMSAMAGMIGQGGSISDKEKRLIEETNSRMAPGMRSSGSGSTSDMEMRAFEDALRPTVGQGAVSDMEGEMARENISANMDMGMDSEMRAEDISDVDKVRMLIDMGLSPKEAMEAIGREKAMEVRPEAFGATTPSEGMGALGGVPTGAMMPAPMPTPRGSTNMGMPEDAVMAQRMNQVDTRGMSPQQIDMLRMGRDPFAEGMVR